MAAAAVSLMMFFGVLLFFHLTCANWNRTPHTEEHHHAIQQPRYT